MGMTDPKEVRGRLVMLQSVLIQEAMEHSAETMPGFRAVTAAAIEEAIFCVDNVHGTGTPDGEGRYYLFSDGGSVRRVRMDGKTAKNRLTVLLNIWHRHGGDGEQLEAEIQEAIRCVEIIHAGESEQDVLYRTFESGW